MNYGMLLAVVVLTVLAVCAGAADLSPLVGQKGVYSVTGFGAKGDGKTDDTAAFQKALDAAGKDGGGIVFAPRGDFLIKGRLNVPSQVALEGVFKAPVALSGVLKKTNAQGARINPETYAGTMLLAVDGKGSEEGNPFIFLHGSSTVKGLAVYYPEQDRKKPVPYPWCIGGLGDNCSVIDVLLVNPWQGVDFGSRPCGRHLIRGFYGQPIKTGIYVDKCLDVGRIEDVHLWPFWDTQLMKSYTEAHGTAIKFGRTDWEFVSGVFCIFFAVGFHFVDGGDGQPNVVINTSGSDLGPCSALIEHTQGHSGVQFVNCQFMAGIDVRETNAGPIKFTNCGFWGLPSTTINHAKILGRGHVTFNACHFTTWDAKKQGDPCIYSDGRALTVNACEFMDGDKNYIVLGEKQKYAIITSNLMRGGVKVENKSKGKVEMGQNVGD